MRISTRTKLLTLSAALAGVAATTNSAQASGICPGNIVLNGTTACHLTQEAGCYCTYWCDDGSRPTYNFCLK